MDDIKRIAEAADNDVHVGWVLGNQGVGQDTHFVVRHNEADLLDQARVADVGEFGSLRAGLGEAGFDTTGLGRIGGVGSGEAVEFSRGCSLDREITHGESSGGWVWC